MPLFSNSAYDTKLNIFATYFMSSGFLFIDQQVGMWL